ncbi:MAG: glycosyl hydrolase, partial [Gemmatimonadota bacterium]
MIRPRPSALLLISSVVVGGLAGPGTAAQAAAQEGESPTWVLDALDWRMVGPYRGGRSTAVTGVPGLPHTYYMGGTGGGVWRTEDAGTTWQPLTDGQLPVAAIGAIAVAEADPNVLYVGTGSACIRGNVSTGRGLYRSLDAGDSWEFIGLEEAGQIGDIQVHPRDPELVYVAALGHAFGKNEERGVFRSRDGGETWENVLFLNDSTGAVDLALNPRNPRILYAGMWRAERKPWAVISGGPEGGLYKSSDGGDSWEKLSGGLPEGVVGKVGITVSPANPDRVWAIVEAEPEGGVYRSDDAGQTWSRVNRENRLRQRAWYYTHIEADPVDEHTVWVLNTGLYRSVDGGSTYESFAVPHGDVHDLWLNPEDPELMVVANDGGAQVSLNGAESWTTYYNQPTAELYDVVVDNEFPYRLWGSQQDNDGISVPVFPSPHDLHPKAAWEYASSCETGPVAFHPDHPEVVWGGCYGGAINRFDREADQRRNVIVYPQLQLGQAAKDLRERFQWVAPIVVSPHDPDVVYHASQRVHRTTDGGMSWETISPDLTTDTPEHQERSGGPINTDITGVEIYNTVFSLAVSPHSPDVIWAGSDDGRIHVTRNGGGSWDDVTPAGMPEFGTVDEIDVSAHREGRVTGAVQRDRFYDFAPYVFQ